MDEDHCGPDPLLEQNNSKHKSAVLSLFTFISLAASDSMQKEASAFKYIQVHFMIICILYNICSLN